MARNMKRKLKILEEITGKANGANEGEEIESFIPEKVEYFRSGLIFRQNDIL